MKRPCGERTYTKVPGIGHTRTPVQVMGIPALCGKDRSRVASSGNHDSSPVVARIVPAGAITELRPGAGRYV